MRTGQQSKNKSNEAHEGDSGAFEKGGAFDNDGAFNNDGAFDIDRESDIDGDIGDDGARLDIDRAFEIDRSFDNDRTFGNRKTDRDVEAQGSNDKGREKSAEIKGDGDGRPRGNKPTIQMRTIKHDKTIKRTNHVSKRESSIPYLPVMHPSPVATVQTQVSSPYSIGTPTLGYLTTPSSPGTTNQSPPNPHECYPKDSYTFIALHAPLQNPVSFGLGLIAFLFQMTFFLMIISSIFHEGWSMNGDVDNPGRGILSQIVPANASPMVHATQITSALTYVIFADSSMSDVATSVEVFPRFRDAKTPEDKEKARRMAVSCAMRLMQGLSAMFAALILIISSNDVIEIVLNFTALNFISNLDDVAFKLALWGRYGERLKKEAADIEEGKLLPACMRSKYIHRRYFFSMTLCGVVLLGFVTAIILAQRSNMIWVTDIIRVDFQEADLQLFTGCYEIDDTVDHYRRKVYKKGNGSKSPGFGYCAEKRQWVLVENLNGTDICNANEKEVAHSTKTDAFDVATVFGDSWFSVSNTPLDLYFISLTGEQDCSRLENGVCDEVFNTFEYRYDGGDCCSATCIDSKCAAVRSVNAFSQNKPGIHFPKCKDPTMKELTIHLSNFTSSWTSTNLDMLYPNRDRSYDNGFKISRTPRPSSLKVTCDDRYVLVIEVDETMLDQTTTIKVNDGAYCVVDIERKYKKKDCIYDCAESEEPFLVFDYTVFEGNKAHDSTKLIAPNLVEDHKKSFTRIPECFSEELSVFFNKTNFYSDKVIMDTVQWMIADKTGNSNCQSETFLRRMKLILFYLSFENVERFLSSFIDTSPTCLWPRVACDAEGSFQLDLGSSSLSGPIPSTIGLLNSLTELTIAQNKDLIGTIPSEIADLSGLSYLNLEANALTGTVPKEIMSKLTQLTYLSFSGNNLQSTIPAEIGTLTNLTHLDFDGNQMYGTIPTEIGKLTGLTSLNFKSLGAYHLNGTIPTEIGKLVHLEFLDIRGNDFTGTIPTEIGELSRLTSLYFGGNDFTGTIPTEIGELSQLTSLSFGDNSLNFSIPLEIGKLSQLTHLELRNPFNSRPFDRNVIYGSIPTEIGLLTLITSLDLHNSSLTGTLPSEFKKLASLEFLFLQGNAFTGTISTAIGELPLLSQLELSSNLLTGKIPSELGGLSHLTSLRLNDNNLNGTIPSELGNFRGNYLYLHTNGLTGTIPTEIGTSIVTFLLLHENLLEGTIPAEIGNITELYNFAIYSNDLTGTIPRELGQLENLNDFMFGDNNFVGTIPTEIWELRSLETVNASENGFSGPIPTEIGKVTSLIYLSIANNYFTGSIPSELGHLQQLKSLDLRENDVTGSLPTELSRLKQLESLFIGGNRIIGDVGFYGAFTHVDMTNQPTESPTHNPAHGPYCEIGFRFLECPEDPELSFDNGCKDRPQSITFRFNGGDCSQSDNLKDRNYFTCKDHVTGGPSTLGETPYYITVGPSGGTELYFKGAVPVGDKYTVKADVSRQMLSADMTIQVFESEGGELLQSTYFHQSCSQQLFLFDRFGSSQVTRWTETSGRVIDDSAPGNVTTTFRFEIIPDRFEPVRLKEFSIISSALDNAIDYTSQVKDIVLYPGDSPPELPGITIGIDYNIRTRYTLFGTIIAESLDGSAECNGNSFMECTYGYNLAPVFPVQSGTQSPDANEPISLPATNSVQTYSNDMNNSNTVGTSNLPPQSQTAMDFTPPDETTIANDNQTLEPPVGQFDGAVDPLAPPGASAETPRARKNGLSWLDGNGG